MRKVSIHSILPAVSGLILSVMCIAPFTGLIGVKGLFKAVLITVIISVLFTISHRYVSAIMSRLFKTPPEKELKLNTYIFSIPLAGITAVLFYFFKGVNYEAGDFSMLGNIYMPWGNYIKKGVSHASHCHAE